MMSSHFLNEADRLTLRNEIVRILKPGGWMFFKSFLADEDLHVKRLLKEHAGEEKNTYIHPRMKVAEHVWSLDELKEFWGDTFEITKIEKSFKHVLRGKAWKRRTVSVHMRKSW
jgi:ubiquinone/menaquinone biosynthesis C-methylase UbiE